MNPLNQEFYHQISRARSRISLKQARSWQQVLEPFGEYGEGLTNSNTPLKVREFNLLVPELERRYRKPRSELSQKIKEILQWNPKNLIGAGLVEQHVLKVDTKGVIHPEKEEEVHPEVPLPPHNPKQKCKLRAFQMRCAIHWWNAIHRGDTAAMLRLNTGDGKTYVYFQVVRWLWDSGWFAKFKYTVAPWKCLIVTKASIVEQTIRVGEDEFGLKWNKEFWVKNYDALRSKFGKTTMIEEKVEIHYGEAKTIIEWIPVLAPVLMILDECHSLKNEDSSQTRTISAFNELEDQFAGHQLYTSASPASRISALKCFCVATRRMYQGLVKNQLTNDSWRDYANKFLCVNGGIEDYSKENIRAFLREFKQFIITAKNVRRRFKAINAVKPMNFRTLEHATQYKNAYEEYLRQKAKIEGRGGNSTLAVLVEFLKFRQAAELLKCEDTVDLIVGSYERGCAPVVAQCFKPSIAKNVKLLVERGFNRNDISLIWGGMEDTEVKYTDSEIERILSDPFSITPKIIKEITKQLQQQKSGISCLDPGLRLGNQSPEARQEEIDRFQSGRSKFCFFTFAAGGAGLSLHHNTERVRQREMYISPTYNEMEFMQASGRCARLTSLSDTYQYVLCYRGTIEMRVLGRMFQKKGALDMLLALDKIREDDREAEELMAIVGGREEDEDSISEDTYGDLEKEI